MSESKPPSDRPEPRPARPQGAHGGPRPPSVGEHVDVMAGGGRDAAAPSLQAELEHERRERARDEATLGEMLVHIAELERSLREAQSGGERSAELESTIETQARALEDAVRAKAEADARTRELENDVSGATAERDVLAARLRALTVTIDAAQVRVEKIEQELRAALEGRARAERDAVELAAEVDDRAREAESRTARATELERRVAELETQLAEIEREHAEARESDEKRKTALHDALRAIDELRAIEGRAAEQRNAVFESARSRVDGPAPVARPVDRPVARVPAVAPANPPPRAAMAARPPTPELAPLEELTLELSELDDG